MRFSTLLQTTAATIALVAPALAASAQVAPITPGQASDAQIRSFVGDRLGRLASGEPLAVRNARTALLAPLRSNDADSAFRLQYSGALQNGGLARLAADSDNLISINAIVVAGELATPLSVTILENALGDRREAIRYEAARSLGILLSAFDADRAAVPANQIDSVFSSIAAQFGSEQSHQVVDALIVALASPNLDPDLRTRCATAMCEGVAEVAKRWRDGAATEAQALAIFRAIDDSFSDLLGGADPEFAKAAAIASGQALAFFLHWVETTPPEQMSDDEQRLAIDLGAGSERVLLLAHSSVTGDSEDERITDPIRAFIEGRSGASIARIRSEIDHWTGAGGRLLSAPYNAAASDFE